ncbi:MAG: PorP/SprF family type IX secretion system membrane protein [Bacteroidales bacterium]|jgi:type IX secretion system PorP/SprF family membrane protein|nr:PorP/SprF family type IX secretion system membrane protein [Bacteroidales bacterium]
MNRVRLFILSAVALLGLGTPSMKAQDAHFSQFYANPLYLNPAYAGSIVCPRIVTNFRHQWPVLSSKYTTYAASYDQHFDAISGGVGVLFLGDRAGAGTITTNAISLIYSFKADLTRDVAMRIALQATYQQKSVDFSQARFGDMIDPKFGFVYATKETLEKYSKGVVDFSTGIIFYSDKFYGGVAVNHFTQPRESFYESTGKEVRLPMKISANFGAVLDIKQQRRREKNIGDMSISPNLIFQYQRNLSSLIGESYSYLNIGLYYSCYPMIVGAWYRQGFLRKQQYANRPDAFVLLAGIEYSFLKIGYSYDFTIPSIKAGKANTGGAHEVSAQFHLPCPVKSRRVRHINCPKF